MIRNNGQMINKKLGSREFEPSAYSCYNNEQEDYIKGLEKDGALKDYKMEEHTLTYLHTINKKPDIKL